MLSDWGYDRSVARTQGLKVLFAGESGTGKTMAAQVLAAELGLELFRVDLATIVSKYIGETEKNLDRIFGAADGSNAILFFDEADALFGKRSEISDSHDRYANIEVAYLLQKMEGYAGAVILATNYRRNIDDAFVRRLDFVIDFPFPEAEDRKRIWRLLLPEEAPLADDLDIDFLATQFKLSGGSIRNCSLSAAFQAADDDGVIGMRHLVRAVALEYGKQGRLTLEADFEQLPRADPHARRHAAQRRGVTARRAGAERGVRQLTPARCAPPSRVACVLTRTNWEEPDRMSSNLAGILTETAAEHGDRPALKLDDTVVTYAQLDDGSARVAALLRDKGVEPGDRVGIMLPNVPYFGVVYYGILRAGGVVVPMNPLLKGREVKFYLEDPGAKLLFAWGDFEEAAEPGRRGGRRGARSSSSPASSRSSSPATSPTPTSPSATDDDTAVLLYTSGTTGTPKGAELTHANLRKNCELVRAHARARPARRTSCSARCRCSTPSGRRAGSTARSPSARACR